MWRPNATFKVQLSKGAKARLDAYYKELSNNGNKEDKAEDAVTKTPEVNAKGVAKPLSLEDAFPIKYLKMFDNGYCGDKFDLGDLTTTTEWVRERVQKKEIDSMPPMEFLIHAQKEEEEDVVSPTYNYHRWIASEDKIPFVEPVEEEGEENKGGDEETTEEEDEEEEL